MKLSVIKNHLGQYARKSQWTPHLDMATFYRKGLAKTQVTLFCKLHPNAPVPTILTWELTEENCTVVNMQEATSLALARINKRADEQKEQSKKDRLASLERQQVRIREELEQLRK